MCGAGQFTVFQDSYMATHCINKNNKTTGLLKTNSLASSIIPDRTDLDSITGHTAAKAYKWCNTQFLNTFFY